MTTHERILLIVLGVLAVAALGLLSRAKPDGRILSLLLALLCVLAIILWLVQGPPIRPSP